MAEVTQADRDAAKQYQERHINSGINGTELLYEAFAAHREQAEREIAAFVRNWNGGTEDGNTLLIADAIERGDWK